jgi:hypothetical protein
VSSNGTVRWFLIRLLLSLTETRHVRCELHYDSLGCRLPDIIWLACYPSVYISGIECQILADYRYGGFKLLFMDFRYVSSPRRRIIFHSRVCSSLSCVYKVIGIWEKRQVLGSRLFGHLYLWIVGARYSPRRVACSA